MELEVTNTSDKPIYLLELWVEMPEIISENGHRVGFTLRYGRAGILKTKTKLVTVLPGSIEASRGYLNSLKVPITEIRQLPLTKINVRGTPTLLLVNDQGLVTKSWVGQLRPDKEAHVLDAVRSGGI